MNNVKLTLIQATTSSNGGFILKLQNKQEVQMAFGTKEQSLTYYMKVAELAKVKVGNISKPIAAGYVADLDIDQFDIVVRDFIPEDGDNAGEVIPCKWLQLKTAA